MEEKQRLKVHGSFVGVLCKEDGTVTTTRKDNMILNCGYDFIADAIGKTSGRPDTMNKIAVGTSDNGVDASQNRLYDHLLTKEATYQHVEGTKSFSISTKFEKGEATGALREACVRNNAGLLDRVVFPVVNKGANGTR